MSEPPRGKAKKRKRRKTTMSSTSIQNLVASVSVTTFAARRLPEIAALYELDKNKTEPTLVDPVKSFASDGGKTGSRHLRKRITSHNPRKRHRTFIPTSNADAKQHNDGMDQASMTRRKRRKSKSLLSQSHFSYHDADSSTSVKGDSASELSHACHWLPTHLWHAKRFHMRKMSFFGKGQEWRLPIQHVHRGGRAALRLAVDESKCWICDVTHEQMLVGTWKMKDIETLIAVLSRMIHLTRENMPRSGLMSFSMLHKVDRFPTEAVGRVEWTVHEGDGSDGVYFLLWTQGYWQASPGFQGCLELLNSTGERIHSYHSQPFSFGVYGAQATAAVLHLFQSQGILPTNGRNLNDLFGDEARESCAHGSLVQFQKKDGQSFCLIRQAPRSVEIHSCNQAVCGWILQGPLQLAMSIWIELVASPTVVSAPMGLSERIQIGMEAHPPLLFSARDDLDTCASRKGFWENPLMQSMFCCHRGRLTRPRNEILKFIDFGRLLGQDKPGAASVVVVRGVFGKPFHDLLQACCFVPAADGSNKTSRRPRRKVLATRNTWRTAMLPPKDHRKVILEQLKHHQQNLSLPAVLMVQIDCPCGGSISAGNILLDSDGDMLTPLGYVTSGSFSPSRGHAHGIGVVGAARFLKSLERPMEECVPLAYDPHDRRFGIPVMIDGGTTSINHCQAILSLLHIDD